jgi:hypothetical protein
MSGFDDLHVQLTARVRAMSADTPATASRPERTPAWRRRPLLVVLVTLGMTAATAAGAVVVATQESAPLSGALPESRAPGAAHATGYRLTVRPRMAVGAVGWCTTITLLAPGPGPHGGGSACGAAPRSGTPVLGAGSLSQLDRPGDVATERQITYAIVDRTIAAARRADGVVVRARSDPRLPVGWRSLIVAQRRAHRVTYLGPAGRPARLRSEPERPPRRHVTVTASALAHRRWCALRVGPGSPARITSARTLASPPAQTRGLAGRPFLSCTTVTVSLRGGSYTAALLLDATDPGRAPLDLPGATKLTADTVGLPPAAGSPAALARRHAGGWLVVAGGAARGRHDVLDALGRR